MEIYPPVVICSMNCEFFFSDSCACLFCPAEKILSEEELDKVIEFSDCNHDDSLPF